MINANIGVLRPDAVGSAVIAAADISVATVVSTATGGVAIGSVDVVGTNVCKLNTSLLYCANVAQFDSSDAAVRRACDEKLTTHI